MKKYRVYLNNDTVVEITADGHTLEKGSLLLYEFLPATKQQDTVGVFNWANIAGFDSIPVPGKSA